MVCMTTVSGVAKGGFDRAVLQQSWGGQDFGGFSYDINSRVGALLEGRGLIKAGTDFQGGETLVMKGLMHKIGLGPLAADPKLSFTLSPQKHVPGYMHVDFHHEDGPNAPSIQMAKQHLVGKMELHNIKNDLAINSHVAPGGNGALRVNMSIASFRDHMGEVLGHVDKLFCDKKINLSLDQGKIGMEFSGEAPKMEGYTP